MHHCLTVPDLVALIGPRCGSAHEDLARGCPRIERTLNCDRAAAPDRVVLPGRRGEGMIFEDAGPSTYNRPAQAKGGPVLTLLSCLVQPRL
jgi:hypothetical protein